MTMASKLMKLMDQREIDLLLSLRERMLVRRRTTVANTHPETAPDWEKIGRNIADRYPNTFAELAK